MRRLRPVLFILASLFILADFAFAQSYDLIIRSGRVVDGTAIPGMSPRSGSATGRSQLAATYPRPALSA